MKKTHQWFVLLTCLSTSSFLSIESLAAQKLDTEILCQKWYLEEYIYWVFTEAPDEVERNDYLQINHDFTYQSISEGVFEEGFWKLDQDKKSIHLNQEATSEELVFLIQTLTSNELIVNIHYPEDYEARHFKIHFKSKKL